MFFIDSDKTIHLNRGDIAVIEASAMNEEGGQAEKHTFSDGDIIRLTVYEKKQYDRIVLRKEVEAKAGEQAVDISLSKNDTKIGELINKPVDYWYEIELNPDTMPQTLVGHDKDGPKIFRLYPEGDDVK